jgi:hypothetical protein
MALMICFLELMMAKLMITARSVALNPDGACSLFHCRSTGLWIWPSGCGSARDSQSSRGAHTTSLHSHAKQGLRLACTACRRAPAAVNALSGIGLCLFPLLDALSRRGGCMQPLNLQYRFCHRAAHACARVSLSCQARM